MHVELYEALKRSIGQEAAAMIAEVVPPARDLATRSDIAELRAEMHGGFSRVIKWTVGVFVPMFAATWGTMIALFLAR